MKKNLQLIATFIFVSLVLALSVWSLTGKYEWKGRPWVRLQATEVIVESTLVVKDSIRADFFVPDDSSMARFMGWADSAIFASNSILIGDLFGADDLLVSARIDSTSYNFFHLGQTFMKDHLNLAQDCYIFFKNSSTSYLKYNNSVNQMQFLSMDGIPLHIMAETLLMHSYAEVGPCAIFRDSTNDPVLTIYNEGGITLAKDWQGIGTWAGLNGSETLAVTGITTSSIALVTACNILNGDIGFDCWTDTCVITRAGAAGTDSFGYLILK